MAEGEKESVVDGIAGAAKEVLVPVYTDAVQPLAKETGKALGIVGRVVNAALQPLDLRLRRFEVEGELIRRELEKRLKDVPPEEIVTPPANVALPAMEALATTVEDEAIREMFLTLLASSMTVKGKKHAHPAYVGILSQMTRGEALLFECASSRVAFLVKEVNVNMYETIEAKTLAAFGSDDVRAISSRDLKIAIENLQRLSLIVKGPETESRFPDISQAPDSPRKYFLENVKVDYPFKSAKIQGPTVVAEYHFVLTDMGMAMAESCMPDRFKGFLPMAERKSDYEW